MEPSVRLESFTISDGTAVVAPVDGCVVLVGPNGGGKSRALRELLALAGEPNHAGAVCTAAVVRKLGDAAELELWLRQNTPGRPHGDGEWVVHLSPSSHGFVTSYVKQWGGPEFRGLEHAFISLVDASERLRIVEPTELVDVEAEAPFAPLHRLYLDGDLEAIVSDRCRAAFGHGIFVDRFGGRVTRLRVGDAPPLPPGGVPTTEYLEAVRSHESVADQGDGVRSFVGLMTAVVVGRKPLILVDEPEAFLHPPQAALIGGILAEEHAGTGQVVLATHSSDVLRGVLNANVPITVVRLRRDGDINHASILTPELVGELWADPLLRYSDALAGLFHDVTVVCESDSDCRFYHSILDVVRKEEEPEGLHRNIHFTHCGGKARMPVLVSALTALDVEVRAVVDFDVLREEVQIQRIVEALGRDWSEYRDDWKMLRSAIESLGHRPLITKVEEAIGDTLGRKTGDPRLTTAQADSIRQATKVDTGWDTVKLGGVGVVPAGDGAAAASRLLDALSRIGVHIVPVGELERFVPDVGSHGPRWVAGVHEARRHEDPALVAARDFVKSMTKI